MIATIETKLKAAFKPEVLKVVDDSVQHYGHDGASPGHVSHVAILVVSPLFAGVSRVERSRMVHKAIAEEVRQIHALTQLKTLTPEEFKAR
jgi:BolA protein